MPAGLHCSETALEKSVSCIVKLMQLGPHFLQCHANGGFKARLMACLRHTHRKGLLCSGQLVLRAGSQLLDEQAWCLQRLHGPMCISLKPL